MLLKYKYVTHHISSAITIEEKFLFFHIIRLNSLLISTVKFPSPWNSVLVCLATTDALNSRQYCSTYNLFIHLIIYICH